MQRISKLKCDLLKKHNSIFGEYPEPIFYKNFFLNNNSKVEEVQKYIDDKIHNTINQLYQEHLSRLPTASEIKTALDIIKCNGNKNLLSHKILAKKMVEKNNNQTNPPMKPVEPITKIYDVQQNDAPLNTEHKNLPNKIFDRIYVTNFERYPQKFTAINDFLKKIDMEATRFILRNPTDENTYNEYTKLTKSGSRIGNSSLYCYLLAYIDILKEAKRDKLKNILVLDDTILFHNNFNNELRKIKSIPESCGIIYLGGYQKEYTLEKIKITTGFYKATQTYGSFALMIRSSIYDTLITNFEKKIYNPDQVLVTLQESKTFYVLWENLVIADLNEKNHINTGRIITITKNKMEIINKLLGWNTNHYEALALSDKKPPVATIVSKPSINDKKDKINKNINNIIKKSLEKQTTINKNDTPISETIVHLSIDSLNPVILTEPIKPNIINSELTESLKQEVPMPSFSELTDSLKQEVPMPSFSESIESLKQEVPMPSFSELTDSLKQEVPAPCFSELSGSTDSLKQEMPSPSFVESTESLKQEVPSPSFVESTETLKQEMPMPSLSESMDSLKQKVPTPSFAESTDEKTRKVLTATSELRNWPIMPKNEMFVQPDDLNNESIESVNKIENSECVENNKVFNAEIGLDVKQISEPNKLEINKSEVPENEDILSIVVLNENHDVIENVVKRELKSGLTFLIHLDDTITVDLETCISSISDIADEILLINSSNNFSTDVFDKLKENYKNLFIYQYDVNIHQVMALKNSTEVLVKYHNWCLTKVTRNNVIEWSADYIPIKENLMKMIRKHFLRLRANKYMLWFLGKKLYMRENNNFVDVKSSLSGRVFSMLHGFKWEENNGKMVESKEYINSIPKPMINDDLVFLKVKNITDN